MFASSSRINLGPTAALLYSAFFWGVVWYPLRLLEAQGLTGIWQTLASFLVAAVLFLPFVYKGFQGWREQPWSLMFMMLAIGWTNIAFVLAMLHGEVVRVLLLFYLSPLWTAILGRWLVHEPWTGKTFLLLGLGLGGAVITLWEPTLHHKPLDFADILALTAGFSFATSNVLNRRMTVITVHAKTGASLVGVVLISAAIIVVMAEPWPQVDASTWAWSGVLGVLGFLLASLTAIYGFTHMPAQRASVIILSEIIVGAISAWALANEYISLQELFGGALIVSAGLVASFSSEEKV